MADYQLTAHEEPCAVIRTEDGACIPPDMANRDYNGDQFRPGYIQWKDAGNTPDPYVEPPTPEPVPTPEQQILFDHENRVLALEGQPPISVEDFVAKATRTPAAKPAPQRDNPKPHMLPKRKG